MVHVQDNEVRAVESVSDAPGPFERVRGRLFGVAYRMLGSRAEAEDVVQDAYIRWHQSEQRTVRNPEAWLVTTATRLAIDRLRALKAERDSYVGPWLPEPLMSIPPSPEHAAELASDVSIAFLVLLERLGPDERAAFLLHEVFDVDYADIAALLDKTQAACRQLVHRAKERVRQDRKRFEAPDAARARLLKRFTAALDARDEQALLALFAPEATWIADGGGRAAAARHPIAGAERIVKLVLGLQEKFFRGAASVRLEAINGETGLVFRKDGHIISIVAIATDGNRILDVYAIVNPDKLPATNEASTSNNAAS
jgi:RNA polymerase sigma-70 factor, ECF subfamily